MSASDLLVKIEILDDHGKVVEERLATTYRKLLEAAHAAGLSTVDTSLLQAPSREVGDTAIVLATATTERGTFTGIGDAAPDNVPEKLRSALVRVAETRALCRALRAALCVPHVAVEELAEKIRFVSNDRGDKRDEQHRERRGDGTTDDLKRPDASPLRRERGRDDRPTETQAGDRRVLMSDSQKRLVFRLCFELGATKENVREHALKALGVERLEWATRLDASRAIDTLKRELTTPNAPRPAPSGVRNGGNGGSKEAHDDIPF